MTMRQAAKQQTRRDIQGLRAIAVALVVVYHLNPATLPGGYVGVDMFFVISGFLITGQLVREAETSGRIDLPRFWARRAKRLLPAALLVLLVTVLAVWTIAPLGLRPAFLTQVAASAGYAQNWVLAAQSVDYSAAETWASPVQHFWSLSVEEQFYIVWPLIAVVALVLLRRSRRSDNGTGDRFPRFLQNLTMLVALVTIASFITSVVLTTVDPQAAYFVTPTRAWEFAIGGLIACALPTSRVMTRLERWLTPSARSAMAWLGLIGIGASVVTFSDATPFPGWIALLPVISTALIIVAAEPETRWSPQPLLARPTMQWLGDISYGAYLWHFPLIVLLPFAFGGSLGVLGTLTVITATLVLAHLSKIAVEDPFRTGFSKAWSNKRTLAVTAVGVAAMLAVPIVSLGSVDRQIVTERDRVASIVANPTECLGATSLNSDSGCDPAPLQLPIPEPALADQAPERCLSDLEGAQVRKCTYGAEPGTAIRTIALVGDSHAEQWLTPLKRIAEQNNWRLIVMAKASCPFTSAERDFVSFGEPKRAELRQDCLDWNAEVLEELEQEPQVDAVVTSAKAANKVVSNSASKWQEAAAEGYERRWNELPETVGTVVAIEDTPELQEDLMRCVTEEGETAATSCAEPAKDALGDDPLSDAAASSERAELISMNDYLVVDDDCPPVIGGVLVYRDSHHLNWAYTEMLTEPLADALEEVLPEHSETVA
ncbi:acyltransferase family protein [Leucobacter denitrificans]|uniref:Acyltransferase n=1 Tax=Leucobacter denitrificans TaxID=683042 RepID=A0A7G9S5Y3_9MICO|nr:acyltransferase family protein [Leucobacter denitrificans]QNN63258.1 acyltransferase [Leucobacter denitrificans]